VEGGLKSLAYCC